MPTERERAIAANNWNSMQIRWLIEYAEKTVRQLQKFETLGKEAAEHIDKFITELECIRSDNEYKEEGVEPC